VDWGVIVPCRSLGGRDGDDTSDYLAGKGRDWLTGIRILDRAGGRCAPALTAATQPHGRSGT